MARRSPLNPRYQKNAPTGKTRRSSSAAKPKRERGTLAGGAAPAKKSTAKGARPSFRQAFAPLPTTPEIRRWRTVWWTLMGVAILSAGSFIPSLKLSPSVQRIALGVEMTALIAALYIDFAIIRRLRRQAIEDQKHGKKSSQTTDSESRHEIGVFWRRSRKSGRGKGE